MEKFGWFLLVGGLVVLIFAWPPILIFLAIMAGIIIVNES